MVMARREKSAPRLVILGRDGVINEVSETGISNAAEWIPISGSLDAIAMLSRAGYKVVVVSNESGIARGDYDIDAFNSIQEKMSTLLKEAGGSIDSFFFSPYGPRENASCRKPRIGMLEEISRRYHVDLRGVPMIGDSRDDIEAAVTAGCRPVLVRSGNGEKTLLEIEKFDGVTIFKDLATAAEALLSSTALRDKSALF